MRFVPTEIEGVVVVEADPIADERGSFARLWCTDEFEAAGLNDRCSQLSLSSNPRAGTLRGLHLAVPPAAESKVVRCISGAIFDVALDARPTSPTCGRHVSVELSARNARALYIAPGIAHGFQTLTEGCEVLYLIDVPYDPAASRCIRYDDPRLAIAWPLPAVAVSARDSSAPEFAHFLKEGHRWHTS